jgi:hypothetical protein
MLLDLTAKDMYDRKIELDTIIFTYRPFFSDEFVNNYSNFTRAAFQEYGEGLFKLRTTPLDSRDKEKDRDVLFTNEDNRVKVLNGYYFLMQGIGRELDVVISQPPPSPSAR